MRAYRLPSILSLSLLAPLAFALACSSADSLPPNPDSTPDSGGVPDGALPNEPARADGGDALDGGAPPPRTEPFVDDGYVSGTRLHAIFIEADGQRQFWGWHDSVKNTGCGLAIVGGIATCSNGIGGEPADVSFTLETVGAGRIKRRMYIGEDGSRQFSQFVDSELDQVCSPRTLAGDTKVRCVAGDVVSIRGSSAEGNDVVPVWNAACTKRAWARTAAAPYLVSTEGAAYREGAAIDRVAFDCTTTPRIVPFPAGTSPYYELDTLPTAGFVEFSLRGGGRTTRADLETWRTPDGFETVAHWFDTNLGRWCDFQPAADGSFRCVPFIRVEEASPGNFSFLTTDSTCQTGARLHAFLSRHWEPLREPFYVYTMGRNVIYAGAGQPTPPPVFRNVNGGCFPDLQASPYPLTEVLPDSLVQGTLSTPE